MGRRVKKYPSWTQGATEVNQDVVQEHLASVREALNGIKPDDTRGFWKKRYEGLRDAKITFPANFTDNDKELVVNACLSANRGNEISRLPPELQPFTKSLNLSSVVTGELRQARKKYESIEDNASEIAEAKDALKEFETFVNDSSKNRFSVDELVPYIEALEKTRLGSTLFLRLDEHFNEHPGKNFLDADLSRFDDQQASAVYDPETHTSLKDRQTELNKALTEYHRCCLSDAQEKEVKQARAEVEKQLAEMLLFLEKWQARGLRVGSILQQDAKFETQLKSLLESVPRADLHAKFEDMMQREGDSPTARSKQHSLDPKWAVPNYTRDQYDAAKAAFLKRHPDTIKNRGVRLMVHILYSLPFNDDDLFPPMEECWDGSINFRNDALRNEFLDLLKAKVAESAPNAPSTTMGGQGGDGQSEREPTPKKDPLRAVFDNGQDDNTQPGQNQTSGSNNP